MDISGPVEVAVSRQILRREHHRAAVDRIDADRTVVAPTLQGPCLGSASYQDRRFVAHCSQRIGRTSISIANARHDRAGIRDVITNGDASGLVHRSTSHPAEIASWRKRSLLV